MQKELEKTETIIHRDLWEIKMLAAYGFVALYRFPYLFKSLDYPKIMEAIDRSG